MREITIEVRVESFRKWVETHYRPKGTPELQFPREVRYALRVWLWEVVKVENPLELEDKMMRELSRQGGLKAAKSKKLTKEQRQLEIEQARQFQFFKD